MGIYITAREKNHWTAFFDTVLYGHENSGVALRPDLLERVTADKAEFAGKISTHLSLKSVQKEVQAELRQLKKIGFRLLGKVRHGLNSQLPAEQKDATFKGYELDREVANNRPEVLAAMRTVVEAASQETDESKKPAAPLLDEFKATHESLQSAMDREMALRADLLENRRGFRDAIKANRVLRSQLTSYLITVLPDDANDAKLIDYGLRRKFAVDQTSASPAVTVVDEEETVVTP